MNLLTPENILLVGSVLLIAGVFLGKTGYRRGLPLLLVFLLVGMCFGTDGLGIQFSDTHTAQNVGMVALCIILFSGGMDTRISSIKPVVAPGLILSTIGVFLTALLTGLFVWWLSGMSWTNIHFAFLPSLLLAATMSSTDSASVFGILGSRKVHLREHLRPMLELESGSNDPMAYMLTIVLIQALNGGEEVSGWTLIYQILLQFTVGGLGGYFIGKAALWLISLYRRIGSGGPLSEDASQASSMISILLLAALFFTFSSTSALGGNGYLAVYICGIVIGNSSSSTVRATSKFMNGLTWFAQIVVFLMLGLLVNPHEMMVVAPVSLLIGVFMILIGRPLSVFLCLAPLRKLSFNARCFVSWVGLRGAVPIIFATYPVIAGVDGASQIFNIVFFVTLLSLLIQGTTVVKCAEWLKLEAPKEADDGDFGVELADDIPTSLETITLTESHFASGDTLRNMNLNLPADSLVIMVRRKGKYLVPNGSRHLRPGDVLLIMKENAPAAQ